MSATLIHFAGIDVEISGCLRQRCAWCGALLIDYDLARVMVPIDQPGRPGTWPVGSLVSVDGSMSYVIEHDNGQPLPEGTCSRLDGAVTR